MFGLIAGGLGALAKGVLGGASKFLGLGGAGKALGFLGKPLSILSKAGGFAKKIIHKGVSTIFGSKAGRFVGNLVGGGIKSIGGFIKKLPGKVFGVLGKGLKFIGGNVLGGIVRGIGGLAKGIGKLFGGLFGGGPSKRQLRIARRAVAEVRQQIRAQLRVLQEEVYVPLQAQATLVDRGGVWEGAGAQAYRRELTEVRIPGAGRIMNTLNVVSDQLGNAVERIDAADTTCFGQLQQVSDRYRAII